MNQTNELLSLQSWTAQREGGEFIPITQNEWIDLFADWCMELFVLRNGEMKQIEIEDWTTNDYYDTYYFVNDGFDG